MYRTLAPKLRPPLSYRTVHPYQPSILANLKHHYKFDWTHQPATGRRSRMKTSNVHIPNLADPPPKSQTPIKSQHGDSLYGLHDVTIPGRLTYTSNPEHYGGICYDFDTEAWAIRYVLENDARIEEAAPQLNNLSDVRLGLSSEDYLALVTKCGLAAGKIYLKSSTIPPLSGFFIEEEFFITCAHWYTPNLQSYFSEGNQLAKISQARLSIYGNERSMLCCHLIAKDDSIDVALFKLDRGEHPPRHYVKISDLYPVDTIPYQSLARERVFSAGYNGADEAGTYEQWTTAYFNSLSPEKLTLLQQHNLVSVPTFSDVFRPCQRTLGLGRIAPQEPKGHRKWAHNVSGWYGAPGSMIGMVGASEGSPKAYIIGIFHGGCMNEELNEFMPFTKRILHALEGVIANSRSRDIIL